MPTSKNSQSGHSILMALAAISIIGTTILALLSMLKNATNQVAYLDAKLAAQSLSSSLRVQLTNPASCIAGLRSSSGFSPQGTTYQFPLRVQLSGGTLEVSHPQAGSSSEISQFRLGVERFVVRDITNSGPPYSSGGSTYQDYLGQVILDVHPSLFDSHLISTQVTSVIFKVNTTTRGIEGCFPESSGNDLAAMCESIGGTFDSTTRKCSLDTLKAELQDLRRYVASIANTTNNGNSTTVVSTPGVSASTPDYNNWSVNINQNGNNGRAGLTGKVVGALPGASIESSLKSYFLDGVPQQVDSTTRHSIGQIAADGTATWGGGGGNPGLCPAGKTCSYTWDIHIQGYGTRPVSTVIRP